MRTTLDGIMNQSAFDGTKRTRAQRCADALTQLCSAASKGKLAGGRSNTKLIATVAFETIVERAADRGVTHVGPTPDSATVRKLACDAHHIIPRVDRGPTNDENFVLLCQRHHLLGHQRGWAVTGTGARLGVHNPDGSTEITRTPGSSPPAQRPRAGATAPRMTEPGGGDKAPPSSRPGDDGLR